MQFRPFHILETSLTADGILVRLSLPHDTPLFSGHFPGQPILPGVGILAMVETALEAGSSVGGGDSTITGYRRVKFRQLISSAGEFTIKLLPADKSGKMGFSVLHSGSEAANGYLLTGPLPRVSFPALQELEHPVFPPLLETLIPHRRPMRIVDELTRVENDLSVSATTVRESWPLVDESGAYSVLLLEVIAQTASALIGWEGRHDDGEPGKGYLVGVRQASLPVTRVPMGTSLTCRVETQMKRDNYAVFKGQVSTAADGNICEAEMQAFKPPEN
jgi:3-hydroxymyristoyl/3-hydroxydecanoyl-(acyl carrier protein) dehydratase